MCEICEFVIHQERIDKIMVNSLTFGDSGLSFDAAAISDAGSQTGLSFALVPNPLGKYNIAADIRFSGTITAIDVSVQGAMNDVDAQYRDISKTTAVGGECIQIGEVVWRFIRVKKNSSTTAATPKITAEIMVN